MLNNTMIYFKGRKARQLVIQLQLCYEIVVQGITKRY